LRSGLTLEQMKDQIIKTEYERCGKNAQRTANRLGIDRSTVTNWLKKPH